MDYNKIRVLRSSRNISVRELARQCNIDHSRLAKLERGELNPTIDTLERILTPLGYELTITESQPIAQ